METNSETEMTDTKTIRPIADQLQDAYDGWALNLEFSYQELIDTYEFDNDFLPTPDEFKSFVAELASGDRCANCGRRVYSSRCDECGAGGVE
jgi:hypothetical protein